MVKIEFRFNLILSKFKNIHWTCYLTKMENNLFQLFITLFHYFVDNYVYQDRQQNQPCFYPIQAYLNLSNDRAL